MIKFAIVCVDDESVVLDGLNAQLGREFGKEYMIEFVQSGEEALELFREFQAESISVPVLITDQIMPGMKGSELLNFIKEISESTLNILLTGQAAADEVGDAVNRGNLYRYIAKPWDRDDLILTVSEALKSFYQQKEIESQNQKLKEYADRLEEKVKLRTKELENEKFRSEELLLNILPEETAEELKLNGISPPRNYPQVTVLFTDFVGFSARASEIKPVELVSTLGECFNAFDEIIDKYHLEKIKTIGDAYMCAGGVPNANTTNANDAVNAAVEMRIWLATWNQARKEEGKPVWEMRIGIHTGEVVAGVIGTKKFAYDLWGDAVNIASRMESHGAPGKINISHSTYLEIQNEYKCEDRGEIEMKGRGKFKMYFLEPITG